jgi:PAS domain S-box-containing protein
VDPRINGDNDTTAGRMIGLYRKLGEKSLDVMVFFLADGSIVHANRAALETYGYSYDEIRRLNFRDLRQENTWSNIPTQIHQARQGPVRFETVHRRSDGSSFPVEATWSLAADDGTEVILSIVRDISDKVAAAAALAKSEHELADFFETAGVPMHWVGPDGIILRANKAELAMLGYSADEYIGRNIADFHADRATIDDILTRLTSGESIHEYSARLRRKDGAVRDVVITSSVLFEDGKFRHTRCVTTDVTERLRAERELRESEERFRLLVQHSANIIWRTGPHGKYLGPQESFERFTGLSYDRYKDDGGLSAVHPDDLENVANSWTKALAEDTPVEFEYRLRDHQREYRHIYTRGLPLRNSDGSVREWIGYGEDITGRKTADAERTELLKSEAEARREAETLNELARTLAGELEQDLLVHRITDAATSLTGAQFGAFFYNVIDQQGESLMLYTLSGAPRSAFEKFQMPRNTPIFGPTFRGEGVVRFDDVTKDERYGTMPPYHGMPEGHLPVCSYLATPVISRSGEVLGGLFFGHSEPGVFTESHERMVVGLAAHAAVAMDNARLYADAQREIEQRQQAEAQLRAARDILEDTVAERTAELRKLARDLRAEVEVRTAAESRLRSLIGRLVNIQEEERRRIGRNIHDHLGQQLTGLRINLASLESQTSHLNGVSELARRIQGLAEELDSSIDFVTWELIPGEIANIGLPAALRELVGAWSRRFNIPAEFSFRGNDDEAPPADVSSNLYRITQEALHNNVKHANATRADVHFDITAEDMKLIVEDDGYGFLYDEKAHNDGHSLGLISMRERASAIDGTLDIESTPGEGTTIYVRVPRRGG